MRIVDAGVVVELLVGRLDPAHLGTEPSAAPHLIDSEVTNACRRLVLRKEFTDAEGTAAMAGFLDLVLIRHPADHLLPRMWELRHNVSAYDATYIALAEFLGASALLTTDARLAAAPGIRCNVVLL